MRVAEIAIRLRATNPKRRTGEPVTCGVPFPRGMLHVLDLVSLVNERGDELPLQVRVLDRWSDGSVRWLLCDWQANVDGEAAYRIKVAETASPRAAVASREMPDNVGQDEARRRVEAIGSQLFSSETIRLVSKDHEFTALPNFDWFIEDEGPLRISVEERGVLTEHSDHIALYTLRTHHFAHSPVVRVHFTITNPNRAEHPGGMWDLGDPGSIEFSELVVRLPFPGKDSGEGRVSVEPSLAFEPFTGPLEIEQVSSGGENWESHNHVAKMGLNRYVERGYRLSGLGQRTGLRAMPIVTVHHGTSELSLSMPKFWQNFPKKLEADLNGIALELFPQGNPFNHELQGGEQKEHVFYVAFGRDTITEEPLEWTRDPLVAVVDPEWIASTGAIPYFTSKSSDPHRDYQALADAAIDGEDTFEKKREVIDEYGWRHFGDIYGDHEAILHTEFGPKPRVSHYNNQYDAIYGFAIHWLRSGSARWFTQMNELAAHVRDIDIYNTGEDKAAYNHGLFWHTYHYVDADTATHRSYPKNGRIPPHGKPVPGGGPGSEQNYATGLMLHYFLTGDEASKEAAIGLARWVIDMDDGRKTVFRWLSTSDTGLASASRSPDYHGPGRGSGNSISALLDGHRLTGDPAFLRKAEQLIRRVIHPSDDVTRMVGMVRDGKIFVDAENRWFYTMFLQALAKYLDHKAELGQLDEHYAYARASLLHYARWMADNEYPYLERPEILEYPTETWAAQDMRKSEVFDYASLHVEGVERDRFGERAEFFFEQSVKTLSSMPTRTLCRPVVLMISHGWRRAWFAAHPDARRPTPEKNIKDFGQRTPFVPQKAIAMKRAKMIAVGMAIAFVAGCVALVVRIAT